MHKSILKCNCFFGKKLPLALIAVLVVFNASLASAENYSTNGRGVIEVIDSLRVVFDKQKQTGYIQYAFCYECKLEKLYLTSTTQAFANGKKVSLSKVLDRLGRYAGLEYDVDSKNVISVSW